MYSRYYFLLNSFLFCVLQQTSCWFSENCPPLPFLICSNVFPLILFSLCFYFILFYLYIWSASFYSYVLLYFIRFSFCIPHTAVSSYHSFPFIHQPVSFSLLFFLSSFAPRFRADFFLSILCSLIRTPDTFFLHESFCSILPSQPFIPSLFYRSTIISRVIQGNTDATNDFYQSWKRSSVIWLSFCDLHHLQRSTCPPFRLARSPWSRYSFTSLHYPSPSVK